MTAPLAYEFVKLVLECEFPSSYQHFTSEGIIYYELTNMIEICAPLLLGLEADDPFLKYEVIGIIASYLQDLEPEI